MHNPAKQLKNPAKIRFLLCNFTYKVIQLEIIIQWALENALRSELQMFHAFIIDDDPFSIDATYILFPWDEVGITKIDKIDSPTGIVERILTEKPHVVFIDIEMGETSGLDVIKECKEKGSNSSFVIISGHDNFNYAHTAVNLGVVYYLLKPIDTDDIQILAQKLKKDLNKNNKFDILEHLSSKDNFNLFISSITDEQKYRLAIANLSDEQKTEIQRIFADAVFKTYKIGQGKYMFILKNNTLQKPTLFELNCMAEKEQIVLAISDIFTKKDDMYNHFKQCNQLSYNLFVRKMGCLLIEPLKTNTEILKNILDNLYQSIDSKYINGVETILLNLPALFIKQRYTMSQAVWFYNAIVIRANLLFNQNNFSLQTMDEEDIYVNFADFKDLCQTLRLYLTEAMFPGSSPEYESSDIWNKVLKYIEKNYSSKIQAQDIYKELYISERTLYYLFKTNTQETFLEFLTRYRIEKAKHFLLTSTMSVSQVAERVGIKDHYYFSRLFKKHTGVTPLQFKTQGGSQENA